MAAQSIPFPMRSTSPVSVSTKSDFKPSLEQLLLRLHSATNIRQFWASLQALISEAAPYDAMVAYVNFLDFESSWRAASVLATPNAVRPVTWFEARRQVDTTPAFVLSRQQRVKLYRLSDIFTDTNELKRTPFFREFLAPGGWHHLAVALFWRGDKVCSEIALRRTKEQGDFSQSEVALLEKLHFHIEIVLNRLISQDEEQARRGWMEQFNDHLPFALLYLNFEFETIYVNLEGCKQCAAWNYGPTQAKAYHPREVFEVPQQLTEACRQLRRQWIQHPTASDADETLSLRHSHPEYPELKVTIKLYTEVPGQAAKPGFVIHLSVQSDRTESSDSLPIHAMLGNLTEAEQGVAHLVIDGLSNAEIAARLHKSIDTVKCQVTSIYKKVGVSSRSRLLAIVRS